MSRDRDNEFDELERALKGPQQQPFVQRPEHMDTGAGSLCWIDGSRLCGPDCVSFDSSEGLDDNGLPLDVPQKCHALTALMNQGQAALSVIAAHTLNKKRSQDERRKEAGGMPPVPDPIGGKR